MLMAANRVGKTISAGCEVAFHLTGEYPEWWPGKVFTKPTLVWTGSPTNETSRDILAPTLQGYFGVGDKPWRDGKIARGLLAEQGFVPPEANVQRRQRAEAKCRCVRMQCHQQSTPSNRNYTKIKQIANPFDPDEEKEDHVPRIWDSPSWRERY